MWEELSKIALLGTEHNSLSETAVKVLQHQGIDVKKEESLVVMEAVALYTQLRRAGFLLQDFKGDLPERASLVQEKICSLRSEHHLQLILDGKFGAILPEFIHHLLENSKCLPTGQLPALMQFNNIRQWWELLEPALGVRGRWLLNQHPDWSRLLLTPEKFDWQTGSKEERRALLQFIRKTEPEKGLQLLRSSWEQENFRDKAAFLDLLETGLSIDDEVFLESVLDDRRKDVRSGALHLLAKIPGSDYSERMFSRALACLEFKAGKLKVTAPEEPEPEAVREGILKIAPTWKGGAKAGYLGQVFSKIPPVRWELHFDKKPGELLRQIERTDWAGTLLRAIGEASVFFSDEKWMGALLAYWFENENSPLWNSPVGHDLLEQAPASTVNQLSIAYLQARTGLPADNTPVFQLLQLNDSQWDNELTLTIISRLQKWLLENNTQDWQSFHYKDYLKMLANRCDPALYAALQKGWNTSVTLWAYWEKPVEEMLNTVLFRKEMILELQK